MCTNQSERVENVYSCRDLGKNERRTSDKEQRQLCITFSAWCIWLSWRNRFYYLNLFEVKLNLIKKNQRLRWRRGLCPWQLQNRYHLSEWNKPSVYYTKHLWQWLSTFRNLTSTCTLGTGCHFKHVVQQFNNRHHLHSDINKNCESAPGWIKTAFPCL